MDIAPTLLELGRSVEMPLALPRRVDRWRFDVVALETLGSREPGRGQPSFDKQYVRDWASGTGWDKTPPAPAIRDDGVEQTRERYVTAYERLSGEPFSAWLERTAP